MSLEQRLTAYRLDKARDNGIPPYCIFVNKVIQGICEKPPHTLRDLINIKGLGPRTVQEYGKDILNLCSGDDIGTPIEGERGVMPTMKPKKKKPTCYGVADGKSTGVYETWSEVKEQVTGYPGAKHQGFTDKGSAEAWVASHALKYVSVKDTTSGDVKRNIQETEEELRIQTSLYNQKQGGITRERTELNLMKSVLQKEMNEYKSQKTPGDMKNQKHVLKTLIALFRTRREHFEQIKTESNEIQKTIVRLKAEIDTFRRVDCEQKLHISESDDTVPVKPPSDVTFSPDQENVIELLDNGENVFMSGPGGTGKSFLIQYVIERYKSVKSVQVCALTGAAAELLECKARTIHSWAGVGVSRKSQREIIERTISFSKNLKPWRKVDILIIDEVSMMSKKLFEILDGVGRFARNPHLPFGGIQLLFSGDFYQLPPVPDREDPDTGRFCFESPIWSQTFSNIVILRQNFRQSDPKFMKVLRQVRRGGISENTYQVLKERIVEDNFEIEGDMKPTIIYPKRHMVKLENDRNMEKLDSDVHTYHSQFVDEIRDYERSHISDKYMKFAQGQLESQMNAESTLYLKQGAQVMCVANISMDSDQQIVNGSQGIVEWFTENDIPVVRFNNGLVVPIDPHAWHSEEIEGLSLTQIPLILSWAITIHKSQGVTLDSAVIDAGPDIFEDGQTYVALSRVKTLEGIFLIALDTKRIKANKKVEGYYASL